MVDKFTKEKRDYFIELGDHLYGGGQSLLLSVTSPQKPLKKGRQMSER